MPVVVDHSSSYGNEDYNPPKKEETDLVISLQLSNLTIKMPCRYSSSPPSKRWPKMIAETYNQNPVGSFAGNFDKPLNCNIRCGNTILTFREFVEFRHDPETECHKYDIDLNEYFKLNLEKKPRIRTEIIDRNLPTVFC